MEHNCVNAECEMLNAESGIKNNEPNPIPLALIICVILEKDRELD